MLPRTESRRDRAKSGARFPQTSWELLADARADARGGPALDEFTNRYYAAVAAYIAALVRDDAEFRDLTHRFFETVVLSGRLFAGANPERGAFRHYLKQTIRNFLIDEHRRRHRLKARAAEGDVFPDALPGGWDIVAADAFELPDQAFQRAWTQSLVRLAIARVKTACDARGQTTHFRLFAGRYLADPARSWRDLGDAFGLDEKTARSRADTVVRRFKTIVRELIAADLPIEGDVDGEIQQLIALQEREHHGQA